MIKKNIIYINKDGVLGGSAVSLYQLIDKIRHIHNIVIVVCQKGPFYSKLKQLKIPVYYIPFKNWRKLKNILTNIQGILKLKKLITKRKPDIIHCNSYEVNPLMVLACSGKIRTICHLRDIITARKARKFLLQKAETIIAVSQAAKTMIQSLHKNIKVIYNGVDLAKAKKNNKNKSPFARHDKKVFIAGIIGNCEPRKRQEDFIRAGLEICSTQYNRMVFHFYIIGNDNTSYADNIKKLIMTHKHNFHFTGYIENIFPSIKKLDTVIITSSEEAFGRTAIEAMACRKPVIATNTGGLPEIVIPKKSGLLFEVGDYKTLARHITFLKTNKNTAKRFGTAGYHRVQKLFSLKTHIDKILALYNNVGINNNQ